MLAEYGTRYQVVDDSGGDGGMDGFQRDRRELHAFYCPMKPETARYADKFQADVGKAAKLRDEAGYDLSSFIFVTPMPMREPLQRQLRDYAKANGFVDGVNVGDEMLEVLYAKHPVLHDQFPELAYPDVQRKLDYIIAALGLEEPSADSAAAEAPGKVHFGTEPAKPYTSGLFAGVDPAPLFRLQEALEGGNSSALYELEQSRLESNTPLFELATLSVQLEHELRQMNLSDAAATARSGAKLAERITATAEEAAFRAQLARVLVLIGSGVDMDAATDASMSVIAAFNFVDAEMLDRRNKEIIGLYSEADANMQRAFKLSAEARNLDAMYLVLTAYAAIELHKAQPHRMLQYVQDSTASLAKAKHIVVATHSTAIRIAKLLGTERLAQAYHNYANDLRLLDEPERALAHAKRALSLAEKCGEQDQVRLSRRLIDSLKDDLPQQ